MELKHRIWIFTLLVGVQASAAAKTFQSRYNDLKTQAQSGGSTAEMSAGAVKLSEYCQKERQGQVERLIKKSAVHKNEIEKLNSEWVDYLASLRKVRVAVKPSKSRGTMGNVEDEIADADECFAFVNNLIWLGE